MDKNMTGRGRQIVKVSPVKAGHWASIADNYKGITGKINRENRPRGFRGLPVVYGLPNFPSNNYDDIIILKVRREAIMKGKKQNYRQWHPLFVQSLKVALKDAEPGQLEIIPEVSLSSKPLNIDMLIIVKKDGHKLKHPISHIFRHYNIIEYKSPEDYLSPDDFDKALVYARLHQVLENSNEDIIGRYTISCVSSKYPRAMMKRIRERGLIIDKDNPEKGIYRINGEMYPIQIVVLNRIENPEHLWPFSPYIDRDKRSQHKAFINLFMQGLHNPADRSIMDLLEFSGKHSLFTLEDWKEVWAMGKQELTNEELQEYFDVMDPVIAERWRLQGVQKGEQKGEQKGIDRSIKALTMISAGATDEDIEKATGLSKDRINQLREARMA